MNSLLTIRTSVLLAAILLIAGSAAARAQCPPGWTQSTNLIPVSIPGCTCMFNVTWCKSPGFPVEYYIYAVTPAGSPPCAMSCWANLTAGEFYTIMRSAVLNVECANFCFQNGPGASETVIVSHPDCIKKATSLTTSFLPCGSDPGKCTVTYQITCTGQYEGGPCTSVELSRTNTGGGDCPFPCQRSCSSN